jgi:hypothetical protein
MMSDGWKQVMEALIAGVNRELPASAPAKTRVGLEAFRVRLTRRRLARGRKKFEQELEAFLQSDPMLRAAAERYIADLIKQVTKRVRVVVRKIKAAARQYKKARRSQGLRNVTNQLR